VLVLLFSAERPSLGVQELEVRTAFDESITHDETQWEHFMRQVSDLTRLARHHPATLSVDQIHVHVLPHIAKCTAHVRTVLASTTIQCLVELAKLDTTVKLRTQWLSHIAPALLCVAGDRGCRKVLLKQAHDALGIITSDQTSAPLALKPLVTYASKNITAEQKALRKAAAEAIHAIVVVMNGREAGWVEREAALLPELLKLCHGMSTDAIGETRTVSKQVLSDLHTQFGTELEDVIAQKIGIDHQTPLRALLGLNPLPPGRSHTPSKTPTKTPSKAARTPGAATPTAAAVKNPKAGGSHTPKPSPCSKQRLSLIPTTPKHETPTKEGAAGMPNTPGNRTPRQGATPTRIATPRSARRATMSSAGTPTSWAQGEASPAAGGTPRGDRRKSYMTPTNASARKAKKARRVPESPPNHGAEKADKATVAEAQECPREEATTTVALVAGEAQPAPGDGPKEEGASMETPPAGRAGASLSLASLWGMHREVESLTEEAEGAIREGLGGSMRGVAGRQEAIFSKQGRVLEGLKLRMSAFGMKLPDHGACLLDNPLGLGLGLGPTANGGTHHTALIPGLPQAMARHASASPRRISGAGGSPSEPRPLIMGGLGANPFALDGWALSPARGMASPVPLAAGDGQMASPGPVEWEKNLQRQVSKEWLGGLQGAPPSSDGGGAAAGSPMPPLPPNKLLTALLSPMLSPRASPRFAALQSPLAAHIGSPSLRDALLAATDNGESVMSPLRQSEVA